MKRISNKGRHLGSEARRYPKQELPPPRFVTPRVADFDTLDDLIGHAGRELGATHSSGSEANTKLYFPRGGRYPYEEATVWRKAGYWHAQGPGARAGVAQLPSSARPISGARQRAAEDRRPARGGDSQDRERSLDRLYGHTRGRDPYPFPSDRDRGISKLYGPRSGAAGAPTLMRPPASAKPRTVRDYVVIDRHDRTVAGPFKSSSDAHQAAGSAGVVKFIPSKPARAAETRSAHRRPSRRR